MIQQPLLLLSDAISGHSGLARIARDLAIRIHADMPQYRVGTLGVGGNISTSSRFPFPNYSIQQLDRMIPLDLPQVWEDFAGIVGDGRQEDGPGSIPGAVRKGTLFTIWNASWTLWLSKPDILPQGHPIRAFLETKPFKKWIYCPVDGHCPDGTLGFQGADALVGFDRVLAYTKYGADVIEKTMLHWGGVEMDIPHLPHGLDVSVFRPRDRRLARQTMVSRLTNGAKSGLIADNQVVLGVVATNSFRKDWGLAFETCAELLRRGHDVLLWGHTDALQPRVGTALYWDIPALIRQFGMEQRVLISAHHFSDDDMAWGLSACDAAMAVGSGEGWGFPIAEALACGVSIIHGDYAGGAEFTPQRLRVEPLGYRLEPGWSIRRPTHGANHWADTVEFSLTDQGKELAKLPDYINWKNAWPEWKTWLSEGK